MTPIRGIALVAATSLLVLSARAEARRGVPDEKTYRAAEAEWRRCFPEDARVPDFPRRPDPEDFGADVEVRQTGGGFHIGSTYSGSGVEGGYSNLEIDFEPRGCHALWARRDGIDGGLAGHVQVGWAKRGPPAEFEIRALLAESARTGDARHAFPRAWLLHKCPGGPSSTLSWQRPIEGPIAPAQPWYAGPPRRAPPTFWSAAALSAIGASGALRWFDEEPEDEGPPSPPQPPREDVDVEGIRVPPTERPVPTFTIGGLRLFESKIPGRNGGRAIALVDRAANRHRWVVATRGCVQGTTVSWVGAIGDRIVGVTHSRHAIYSHDDAILIIDTPTATAWAVELPDSVRELLVESGRKAQASLSGSVLALRVARTKAKLDLAPLLALIPAHE